MKKILLTLIIGVIAAFGLGATGAAQAANCTGAQATTLTSAAPSQGWTELSWFNGGCTNVDSIDTSQLVFIGGCGSPCTWVYAPYEASVGNGLPSNCATTSGCNPLSLSSRIDPFALCPTDHTTGGSYHNGIPYWWGVEFNFRIHNSVTHTWGSWSAFTPSAAGLYAAC